MHQVTKILYKFIGFSEVKTDINPFPASSPLIYSLEMLENLDFLTFSGGIEMG